MLKRQSAQNRREAIRISTAMATAGLAGLASARATHAWEAQDEKAKPAAAVPARAEDVRSIDAIIAAVYDAISGAAGRRDWDRLRSLFHPGARLIPCFVAPEAKDRGLISSRVLSIEEFIKVIEPRVKAE